ncbi:CBS domain-containing protein [Chitinispirillales bacterium ANBcel5]|uniref:CBS domain-containing protein n=1 Tax=Cellulosispirillum alkaliphilum TaxID=3039283 RepID=UPI002A50FB89|nr:CBS domain-containing protein [Chitinispirillales bacterium ANBcel5]
MTSTPLDSSSSSLLALEIIFKLKVKDAMSKNLVTACRIDSLRHVQRLMKQHNVSGVPIAENGRLLGLISVDNILRALDFGYIEHNVEPYMTRNLIVLEDDMPLSFGISWFEKYPFRRFPVLNRDEKLVGMLTSRDIIFKLLSELNKEVDRIESRIPLKNISDEGYYHREFKVNKFDFKNGGIASNEFRKVLKIREYDRRIIRRVAIASYELEMNLVAHSEGGNLIFTIGDDYIEIIAKDRGPGIQDVQKALTEGFSTASEWIRSLGFGAGMGLPNTKRSSDEFEIRSQQGLGTIVKARFNLNSKPVNSNSDEGG